MGKRNWHLYVLQSPSFRFNNWIRLKIFILFLVDLRAYCLSLDVRNMRSTPEGEAKKKGIGRRVYKGNKGKLIQLCVCVYRKGIKRKATVASISPGRY